MPSTTFVDSSAHPAAIPYYNLFPDEPIPPETASGVVTVTRQVDLKGRMVETLLEAIAKNVKKGGSILIVSHGNDNGISINIGKAARLEAATLRVLRSNMEGRLVDFEAAKILRFGDFNAAQNPAGIAQLGTLKKLIEAVQKLELDRVDLRSCETGKSPSVLSQLQVFFNCKTLCAPKAFDSFGPIPVAQTTTSPAVWKAWQRDHPKATIEGTGKERFALEYKILANQYKVMLAALATSEEAVRYWVKKHLPNASYKGGPVFYHGLTRDQVTMIFAGDPGYRDQLVEVVKGKDQSVVDPNAPLPRP